MEVQCSVINYENRTTARGQKLCFYLVKLSVFFIAQLFLSNAGCFQNIHE